MKRYKPPTVKKTHPGVMSVEEIKARQKLIAGMTQQAKEAPKQSDGSIVMDVPVVALSPEARTEVIKAQVQRIESPPVGLTPVEQTPNETLSSLTEKRVHDISAVLSAAGIDPVQELIDAYNERDDEGKFVMSAQERRSLMKELMKYTHPQLKAVDHSGTIDKRVVVVLEMPDGSTRNVNANRQPTIDA